MYHYQIIIRRDLKLRVYLRYGCLSSLRIIVRVEFFLTARIEE
jgi:hypothetical protein